MTCDVLKGSYMDCPLCRAFFIPLVRVYGKTKKEEMDCPLCRAFFILWDSRIQSRWNCLRWIARYVGLFSFHCCRAGCSLEQQSGRREDGLPAMSGFFHSHYGYTVNKRKKKPGLPAMSGFFHSHSVALRATASSRNLRGSRIARYVGLFSFPHLILSYVRDI